MKKLFRSPSLTKNWPGGRRNAVVDGYWNTSIVSFTPPYNPPALSEPALSEPSEGGMAEPSEVSTQGPSTNLEV